LMDTRPQDGKHPIIKPKDLVGIPWMVAFALRADGWWLRSDIIWAKGVSFLPDYAGSCMPESVRDRPTTSHEHVFLLSKSADYYWDAEAVKEPSKGQTGLAADFKRDTKDHLIPGQSAIQHRLDRESVQDNGTRNLRTAWVINPHPYKGAHFATFPPKLVEPCIKAGTSERGCCPKCGAPWERVVEKAASPHTGKTESTYAEGSTAKRLALLRQAARGQGGEYGSDSRTLGWRPTCECYQSLREQFGYTDEELTPELFRLLGYHLSEGLPPVPCTVLDPFAGSGTTGQVAVELGRSAVLIDLNPEYREMQVERVDKARPRLF
jgi:hypothetical protein